MEDIPKKRGRKPKLDDTLTLKKKRGRKPTGKIIEIGNLTNFPKCIIAHLPLTSVEISKITGTQNVVEKVDKIVSSISVNINDDILDNKKCNNCVHLEKQCSELRMKLNESQVDYEAPGEHKQYLCKLDTICYNNNIISGKKTDICCWWCCNQFDTLPIGLPEKYIDTKFYVHGCFCSFSCAHSYNLNMNDNRIWDRFSLLNYMKLKITGSDSTINTAPPREALNMFGGPLSIVEFRKKCISLPLKDISSKEYSYLLPPLIPYYGVLDEIPLIVPSKHLQKLKRNKPLQSNNNNLLDMML